MNQNLNIVINIDCYGRVASVVTNEGVTLNVCVMDQDNEGIMTDVVINQNGDSAYSYTLNSHTDTDKVKWANYITGLSLEECRDHDEMTFTAEFHEETRTLSIINDQGEVSDTIEFAEDDLEMGKEMTRKINAYLTCSQ